MKIRNKKRSLLIFLLLLLVIWTLWGNQAISMDSFLIQSSRLPAAFDGFRIAQISDLHNAEFGKGNGRLLDLLASSGPDIIVITGDLIDGHRTDIPVALEFCAAAGKLAPVYYVTGNHEAWIGNYPELKAGLVEAGVTILENASVPITRNGEAITLLGMEDPSFLTADPSSVLSEMVKAAEGYTILLSHRPELFEVYTQMEIDLIFSGHAHGGQFRLPLIGGLVAPNQGLFPKYDGGEFQNGPTTMLVSRGLGNSVIPIRFCNRPQILVAELRTHN